MTPVALHPDYTEKRPYIFRHGKGATCQRKAWRMMLTVAEYREGTGPLDSYCQPCPDCGRARTGEPVRGRFKPDIKCNAKCQGATGHDCDCSCGGKNHGASFDAAPAMVTAA